MTPPAIFISYRIADTLSQAGRLSDALASEFGQEQVFYDKNSLQGGDIWPDKLADTVRKAQVVLVLYASPKWLGVQPDEYGRTTRRIDDPKDWVRKEVETALADSQKLVIPVLFNDAKLPPDDALPDTLKSIRHIQQQQIREAHWKNDLQPLIHLLREHLEHGKTHSSSDSKQKQYRSDEGFHAYTCDRDEQYNRFDEFRSAIQPGSIHFFYLYGGELHAHLGFFRRIQYELAGRYLRMEAGVVVKPKQVVPVEFVVESEGVSSPERLRERFVRNLYTELGLIPNDYHPLSQQNLQNLLLSSHKTKSLRAGDHVLVFAHISHWYWNAALTPDAARWFASSFCPPQLPSDGPAVLFFFAFDFNEEDNPGVRDEVLQVIEHEAEYVRALPELQMVEKKHVGQWLVRYERHFSVPLRRQLLAQHFTEQQYYMEYLQPKLKKLIQDHFNSQI